MTSENSLGPCERFTVLESRKSASVTQCEVCDHLEASHANAGRRTLSGGEIEELRRRILVERFEMLQRERRRSEAPDGPGVSKNGDPELR